MKAWQLIERPENWAQGGYAKDPDGQLVNWKDDTACCWCVLGALHKCYPSKDLFDASSRLVRDRILRFAEGIDLWNDSPSTTHAQVLAVLKELDV